MNPDRHQVFDAAREHGLQRRGNTLFILDGQSADRAWLRPFGTECIDRGWRILGNADANETTEIAEEGNGRGLYKEPELDAPEKDVERLALWVRRSFRAGSLAVKPEESRFNDAGVW
jgi:hypothetical protein